MRFALLATAVVGSMATACSMAPRISNASREECQRSLEAVVRSSSGRVDSAAFAAAYLRLAGVFIQHSIADAFSGFSFDADNAVSVSRPPSDSTDFNRAFCKALNGLNVQQITAAADSLGAVLAREYRRIQDSAYVVELERIRVAAARAADSLALFRVVSSRLVQRSGYFRLETLIAILVHNRTGHAISRAYFRGRSISEGRQVAWLDESFNYQIPGGLEPNEYASWRLDPGFSGRWADVRVPADARFEVQVIKLDGPDGLPLWGGATFTAADQRLLDSLRSGVLSR